MTKIGRVTPATVEQLRMRRECWSLARHRLVIVGPHLCGRRRNGPSPGLLFTLIYTIVPVFFMFAGYTLIKHYIEVHLPLFYSPLPLFGCSWCIWVLYQLQLQPWACDDCITGKTIRWVTELREHKCWSVKRCQISCTIKLWKVIGGKSCSS